MVSDIILTDKYAKTNIKSRPDQAAYKYDAINTLVSISFSTDKTKLCTGWPDKDAKCCILKTICHRDLQ